MSVPFSNAVTPVSLRGVKGWSDIDRPGIVWVIKGFSIVFSVGGADGLDVGESEGEFVAISVGELEGEFVGLFVGVSVGFSVGLPVGVAVGESVGRSVVGAFVGPIVGRLVGERVGLEVIGALEGERVGLLEVIRALVGVDVTGISAEVGRLVSCEVSIVVGASVAKLFIIGASTGDNNGAISGGGVNDAGDPDVSVIQVSFEFS